MLATSSAVVYRSLVSHLIQNYMSVVPSASVITSHPFSCFFEQLSRISFHLTFPSRDLCLPHCTLKSRLRSWVCSALILCCLILCAISSEYICLTQLPFLIKLDYSARRCLQLWLVSVLISLRFLLFKKANQYDESSCQEFKGEGEAIGCARGIKR
jgi:hypothetical protein